MIDLLAILILEKENDENLGFCALQTDGIDLAMDTPAENLAELLQLVSQNRYLVLRERFALTIEGHNIFSNPSKNPQAPVWLQLAVALDRLGTNGNGASLGRSRKLWGLGKGRALFIQHALSSFSMIFVTSL
ncbi:hypothetical protein PHMEG_00022090 [Phytophthora megakarya]|uniref:Uncharacterized protein n=1 Tax=Phytophthora megakarya TaxID=4795 RepID=A0A225VJN5_9STRA|nr:hypothetical protein PHMEG_00022090 [Phytophthora megakarya]